MPLFLDIGRCEQLARRGVPPGSSLTLNAHGPDAGHGTLLACAEGVPGRPEPEAAAKTAATALADGYAASQGFSPRQALEQSLRSAHESVLGTGERGRAAVLTALVLRGRDWLVGHAGSARAWLYHDLQLKQLTRDHLLPRPAQRPEITNACGFGTGFGPDFSSGPLAQGDILLITSPGVHEAIAAAVIMGVLQSDGTAQQMAEQIVQKALDARAPGYVGVCLARVERLPPENVVDAREGIAALPVIAPPEAGAEVDGFAIEKIVHTSRRFRLYKALDGESGKHVVLRFPNPSFYDDPQNVQTFLREEWVGKRIESPYLVKTVALRPGRRTALYSVMEHNDGENLAKRIRRKEGLPVAEALRLGEQLLTVLETLHSQGIIHRDVRANNLLFDKQTRELRLLGLGASSIQELRENDTDVSTSALSYCAPELFRGAPASAASDLYAAGVTIYHMITSAYPYGKIHSPKEVGRRVYAPIGHYKDGLPSTLDDLLRRACAADASGRYANTERFLAAVITARTTIESGPKAAPTEATGAPRHWPSWIVLGTVLALLVAYLYFGLRG